MKAMVQLEAELRSLGAQDPSSGTPEGFLLDASAPCQELWLGTARVVFRLAI